CILLTLDTDNDAAVGDRPIHLVEAVENLGIDAACPLLPPTVPVRLLEPEARLPARQVAHLAKAPRPTRVAIDVRCQLGSRGTVALLGPGPAAVIAAPPHRVVGLDGDAEYLVALMPARTPSRAFRACGVVAAGRSAVELDAVGGQ